MSKLLWSLDIFNLIIYASQKELKFTYHFKILPHEAVQVVHVLSI